MSSLLDVSLWQSGIVSVSYTRDSGFEYSSTFYLKIVFITEISENI